MHNATIKGEMEAAEAEAKEDGGAGGEGGRGGEEKGEGDVSPKSEKDD